MKTWKVAAEKAIQNSDMLVISAGSSVSTRDMTADVIASLGEPRGAGARSVHQARQAHHPGVGGGPNRQLACRAIPCRRWSSLSCSPFRPCTGWPDVRRLRRGFTVTASLTHNIASITGREDYVPVKLETTNDGVVAVPVFGESNLISTMINADGMAKVPLDKAGLYKGDMVSVRLF